MNIGQHVTPTIKLVRLLGYGGMSSVWVAEHLTLGTEVAVKLMSPGYADDERMVVRFRQEAQQAARIKNPHVTRVFDHGITSEGQPYIVMELLEGETLRRRMDRGPMPLAEVVWLVSHAAKGLGAAHKLGLVHRDIKPDNLFVIDNEGEPFVKVLDFGIAKRVGAGITTTGKVMGTPLYMSPEHFDAKSVDRRADLWSLGVVAYEALTGKAPFAAPSLMAIFMAVQNGDFQPPSALRPELPKAVDAWMTRALSRGLDARFDSAMEMAEALWRAQGGREGEARISAPPSSREGLPFAPTVPEIREEPTPPKPDSADAESIRKRFQELRAKSERPPGNQADEEPPLSIGQDRDRGLIWLSVRGTWPRTTAFDELGESLFLTFATGEVLCLDLATQRPRWWSRRLDARPICTWVGAGWLVLGCSDGMIRTLDVKRGTAGKTLQYHAEAVRGVAIDPASQTLAACGADGQMSVWSLESGQRRSPAMEPSNRIRCVTFDATSGLWAGARDYAVHLWDTSFREVQVLRAARSSLRSVAFSPDGAYLAAGCGDGTVMLWETRRFSLVKTLAGHTKQIGTLTVLPRHGGLVSGSSDGTVRIWDIATGKTQLVMGGRAAAVECVATSPNGRAIAAACADGKVRIYAWPIHPSLGRVPSE